MDRQPARDAGGVEPVVDGTLVGLDGSPWDAVEPGAFGVRVGEVSV
ncbi:hypothetical protein ACWEFJ_34235 [Actinosynnema sp. NPDC004786]